VLGVIGPELTERCSEYARTRFGWERTIEAWEAALEDARHGGHDLDVPVPAHGGAVE
jgi:hypothetical protein